MAGRLGKDEISSDNFKYRNNRRHDYRHRPAQAQIPQINIEETWRAAARAMVGLMGRSTTEQDRNACLESEQKAREQIIKD
jgi:hypothetical protein